MFEVLLLEWWSQGFRVHTPVLQWTGRRQRGEIEPLWGRFHQQISWWPWNENRTDLLRGGRSVDHYVVQGWRYCQRVGCIQLESLLGGVWATGQSPGTPPGLPGVSKGNGQGVCQIDSDPVSSYCHIDKRPYLVLSFVDRPRPFQCLGFYVVCMA